MLTQNRHLSWVYKSGRNSGIVLLVTMVILIVLAGLGYTLTVRVAAQRHRDLYIIDYTNAQYACDSAVKYALATIQDMNIPEPIERPNEPDFSKIFSLSEEEYQQYLDEWGIWYQQNQTGNPNDTNSIKSDLYADTNEPDKSDLYADTNEPNKSDIYADANDPNQADDSGFDLDISDFIDINSLADQNDQKPKYVRGPYGPAWPLVLKTMEFEIGSATVKIEIEDENAKYPITWLILDDPNVQKEVDAGFEMFCNWMDINDVDMETLAGQFEQIKEIKPFKLKFKPIKIVKEVTKKAPSRRGRRSRSLRTKETIEIPASVHNCDIAKLLHSGILDTDLLAKPMIVTDTRKESALKYMGLWGSDKVNINTAPQNVLEAAFTFGGDQVEIAEQIIEMRRKKPFQSIDDLKKSLLKYSVSIAKCEKYITTVSNYFTIRVSAVSGTAKVSAVIAIIKNGKSITRIAVLNT